MSTKSKLLQFFPIKYRRIPSTCLYYSHPPGGRAFELVFVCNAPEYETKAHCARRSSLKPPGARNWKGWRPAKTKCDTKKKGGKRGGAGRPCRDGRPRDTKREKDRVPIVWEERKTTKNKKKKRNIGVRTRIDELRALLNTTVLEVICQKVLEECYFHLVVWCQPKVNFYIFSQ